MIILEIHRKGFNKTKKTKYESVIMLIPKSGEGGGGGNQTFLNPNFLFKKPGEAGAFFKKTF